MSRKTYPAKFKAKVALEAIKEEKTLNELSGLYEVSPKVISSWKKYFLEHMEELFENNTKSKDDDSERVSNDDLYKQIGQQKVEIDWLKKKFGL
jgi:transposase-like protein